MHFAELDSPIVESSQKADNDNDNNGLFCWNCFSFSVSHVPLCVTVSIVRSHNFVIQHCNNILPKFTSAPAFIRNISAVCNFSVVLLLTFSVKKLKQEMGKTSSQGPQREKETDLSLHLFWEVMIIFRNWHCVLFLCFRSQQSVILSGKTNLKLSRVLWSRTCRI